MLEMKQIPHDGVMTQRSGLGTTPAQNVISQLLTCEADGARQEDDSNDGLPPPIPLHQMHCYAYGAPVLPLSQPKALQCTVPPSDKLQHVGGGLDGGTSCISDYIEEGNDRRGFVDTDSPAPLNQNLKFLHCVGKSLIKERKNPEVLVACTDMWQMIILSVIPSGLEIHVHIHVHVLLVWMWYSVYMYVNVQLIIMYMYH